MITGHYLVKTQPIDKKSDKKRKDTCIHDKNTGYHVTNTGLHDEITGCQGNWV